MGCGDGINAAHFKECFKNAEYFGIDISRKSIEQAEKLGCSDVHFECYDGMNIPYKDNFFDIIFIACVLHHVSHKKHEKLLLECKRVLNANGRLYIFEHNPMNPITRKIVNDCEFDKDAVLVHKHNLKKVIKQIGFYNIKISYIIFFPRKGVFNNLLCLEKWLTWCPIGGQYYLSCRNN